MGHEPGFKKVQAHTFSYEADLLDRAPSPNDMHDFGKSPVKAMADDPTLREHHDCRIVLIDYSMGDPVVKEASMLAQDDPALCSLKSRIQTLFFHGTPHEGSESAGN